jgi:hypothetical protein
MRVTLQEIEPSVWRRLIVPRAFHLGELHQVIQAAFGWWDYHLHEFQIGGLSFSDPDLLQPEFEGDPRVYDEREVQMLDFSRGDDINFVYVYDFGDDWHHRVEFEQLLVVEPATRVARCVDGARARPPEDVGGPPGYAGFLESLADRRHPEHADYKPGSAVTSIRSGSTSICAIETCAEPSPPIVQSVSSSHVGVGPPLPQTQPDDHAVGTRFRKGFAHIFK